MNIKVFDKNIAVKNSPAYIAYLILGCFKNKKKIAIYSILKKLKGLENDCNPKQFMNALFFLYSANMIEFKEPYVEIKC